MTPLCSPSCSLTHFCTSPRSDKDPRYTGRESDSELARASWQYLRVDGVNDDRWFAISHRVSDDLALAIRTDGNEVHDAVDARAALVCRVRQQSRQPELMSDGTSRMSVLGALWVRDGSHVCSPADDAVSPPAGLELPLEEEEGGWDVVTADTELGAGGNAADGRNDAPQLLLVDLQLLQGSSGSHDTAGGPPGCHVFDRDTQWTVQTAITGPGPGTCWIRVIPHSTELDADGCRPVFGRTHGLGRLARIDFEVESMIPESWLLAATSAINRESGEQGHVSYSTQTAASSMGASPQNWALMPAGKELEQWDHAYIGRIDFIFETCRPE